MLFRETNTNIIVRQSTCIHNYVQYVFNVTFHIFHKMLDACFVWLLNVNGLDICTLYKYSIMSLLHFHLHPIPPQPKYPPPLLKKINNKTLLFNSCIQKRVCLQCRYKASVICSGVTYKAVSVFAVLPQHPWSLGENVLSNRENDLN